VLDSAKPRKRWAVDRQQLLILVAAAVMLGSFTLFVLVPKHGQLSRLNHAVEQERRQLSQRVSASHEGVFVTARIPMLRKGCAAMDRRLPTEPRVAEFLEMLHDCLAETPEVTHEVARSGSPWGGSAPAVPLRLCLSGPFEAVYRGLAGVERIERLNRFRHVRICAAETPGHVVAEAELLIYYLPADAPENEAGGTETATRDARSTPAGASEGEAS